MGENDDHRHRAGVAAFIKHQYMRGVLGEAVLFHSFFLGLHSRPLSSDWPLLNGNKAFHSWEGSVPEAGEAMKAMRAWKEFFQARVKRDWGNDGSDNHLSDESRLGKDVGFAADLTEKLLEMKNGTERGRGAEDMLEERSRQAQAARNSRDPVEGPGHSPAATESILPEKEDGTLTPPRTLDCASNKGYKIQNHPPYQLSGRSWLEDDVHFADLIGEPYQWPHPPPKIFTTIRGGYDRGCWHFIDATALGIAGLQLIKVKHPLDEESTKDLDWDVLRLLRLALWDYTNGHSCRAEERATLKALRREIQVRKDEMRKLRESSANLDNAEAAVPDIVLDKNCALRSQRLSVTNGRNWYAVTLKGDRDTIEQPPELSIETLAELGVNGLLSGGHSPPFGPVIDPEEDWALPPPQPHQITDDSPWPEILAPSTGDPLKPVLEMKYEPPQPPSFLERCIETGSE